MSHRRGWVTFSVHYGINICAHMYVISLFMSVLESTHMLWDLNLFNWLLRMYLHVYAHVCTSHKYLLFFLCSVEHCRTLLCSFCETIQQNDEHCRVADLPHVDSFCLLNALISRALHSQAMGYFCSAGSLEFHS